MRHRFALILASILVLAPLAGPAASSDPVDSCLAMAGASRRVSCIREAVAGGPLADPAFRRLSRHVAAHPEDADLLVAAVGAEPPNIRWFDGRDRLLWSLPVDEGRERVAEAAAVLRAAGVDRQRIPLAGPAGEDAGPLAFPVWLRPLPALELSLLDGGTLELSSRRGRVVILDFWATWCAPCLEELPHLQNLWRELSGRGLDVIAVNASEPDDTVRDFAEQIGLELPVARYDADLDRVFHVGRLPTVVLVDRQGRLRRRWNGYVAGQERGVEAAARELLDPSSEPSSVEVGSVRFGDDRLEPLWARKIVADVSGLAIARAVDGRPRIVVSRTGALVVLDSDGVQLRKAEAPPEAGRLSAGRRAGGPVVAFRRGGTGLVLLDPDRGLTKTVPSPSPVMDVAFVGGTGGEAVRVATLAGVLELSGDANHLQPVASPVEALSIARTEASGVRTLTPDGRVVRVAAEGAVGEPTVVEGAWSLVAGPDPAAGWGALPAHVRYSTLGRFVEGERPQLALALHGDLLVVLEAGSGQTIYAASIPGLGPLAAADLDGDGHDELLAVAKRRLLVWRRSRDVR